MQRCGAILVFDNDLTIVEVITAILGDEGYVVRTNLDSRPASTARTAQPPALIMLDLALPVLTMATVLEYAHSHPSDVPVILMTTSPSLAAAYRARGGECLMKPFALDDLLACVAYYVHLPRSRIQPLLTTPARLYTPLRVSSRLFFGMSLSARGDGNGPR